MAREVIESVRVVIKTDDGIRFEYTSKGSAPRGMLGAFSALPEKRRKWLMEQMAAEDARIKASAGGAAK